jgi:hypothetical protein
MLISIPLRFIVGTVAIMAKVANSLVNAIAHAPKYYTIKKRLWKTGKKNGQEQELIAISSTRFMWKKKALALADMH